MSQGTSFHGVMLSLQGFEVPEIARKVRRTERTVRLVLERVRKILEQMSHEESEA